MGQLNIRTLDVRYAKPENVSAKKDTKDVSDDFKKLLGESPKQEQEVSSEPGKETAATEQESEKPSEDVKTEEMLSGMQMGQLLWGIQNFQTQPKETSEVQPTDTELAVQPELNIGVAEAVENVVMPEENAAVQETAEQEVMTAAPVMVEADDKKSAEAFEMPVAQNQEKVADTYPQAEKSENTQVEVKPEASEMNAHKGEISKEEPKAKDGTNDSQLQKEQFVQPVAAHNVENVSSARETQHVQTQTMHVSQPEEIPEKLPAEMLTQISKGVKEFEIQIAPEHLGKIAIKVLYEDDQTIISIACSEKKTMDIMGHHAREIGDIMERNLGTATEIYVEEKAEDYLNQKGNENDQSGRESEQDRQREESRKQKTDDSGQFLQKLRLGLVE